MTLKFLKRLKTFAVKSEVINTLITSVSKNCFSDKDIFSFNGSFIKVISISLKSFLLNKLFYEHLLNEGVLEDHIIKIALDDLENISLLNATKLNEYIRSRNNLNPNLNQNIMNLSEIDVLILYGLTFFVAGFICWFYLWGKNKKPYNPFRKSEVNKGIAACCEEAGQVFYIYAMALKPVLAAPMVASYCIISVVLSRIFIKEKLRRSQYFCVVLVIIGIVILGISEGLAS